MPPPSSSQSPLTRPGDPTSSASPSESSRTCGRDWSNETLSVMGQIVGQRRKTSFAYQTQSRNARGRWDRNRTCNLRFWSTRRTVQSRPRLSRLPSNSQFLAMHRPKASKNVQPVCSQFCSHTDCGWIIVVHALCSEELEHGARRAEVRANANDCARFDIRLMYT